MSSKCPFNPMKLRSLSCLANWNSNSVQNHWKVRSKPKHTVPNPPKVGVLPEHPSIMIMYACIYNCTIVVQMTFRSFSSIWDSYRNSIQFDDFPSEKTPFIVFFFNIPYFPWFSSDLCIKTSIALRISHCLQDLPSPFKASANFMNCSRSSLGELHRPSGPKSGAAGKMPNMF